MMAVVIVCKNEGDPLWDERVYCRTDYPGHSVDEFVQTCNEEADRLRSIYDIVQTGIASLT